MRFVIPLSQRLVEKTESSKETKYATNPPKMARNLTAFSAQIFFAPWKSRENKVTRVRRCSVFPLWKGLQSVIGHHAPQKKHHLPEKHLPQSFSFWDFFSKQIGKWFDAYCINVFAWVTWHYLPRTPVLVEFITVTHYLRDKSISRKVKRDKLKGTNGAKIRSFFLQIVAGVCWFSFFPGDFSISEVQIFAENRRFSQKTAGNRRYSQKTGLSHPVPWTP